MSAVMDWVYGIAEQIDGEWGCCHTSQEIREGRLLDRYSSDYGDPLPVGCYGPGVVEEYLAALALDEGADL